tara:strand:- start:3 stop:278 length:276 start_codon:yes stop_codon:yes gene_type:complete
MKITKRQLRRIIREEKQRIEESRIPGRISGSRSEAYNAAHEAINNLIREIADTYTPEDISDGKQDARNSGAPWGPDSAIFWTLSAALRIQQ